MTERPVALPPVGRESVMPSNLFSLYESPPSIDQMIDAAQTEINKQEATLLSLAKDGHETRDATKRLGELLATFTALVQMKRKAR